MESEAAVATRSSNFHESYRAHDKVKGSTDQAFSLTVGGILLVIGLYRCLPGDAGMNALTLVLLGVGAILLVLGLVAARLLAPLNRAWTKLGLVLFKVVNPVVMLLIYALTIVPIGLAMRACGCDPLRLKRPAGADTSYWIKRDPPGPAPQSMTDQF
jgi:hypothetical protein